MKALDRWRSLSVQADASLETLRERVEEASPLALRNENRASELTAKISARS